MKKPTTRQVLKTINNYVVFFLTVAFAVSCCMMLFVRTLADSMSLVFTQVNIGAAAMFSSVNVSSMVSARVFTNSSIQQVIAKATTRKKTT